MAYLIRGLQEGHVHMLMCGSSAYVTKKLAGRRTCWSTPQIPAACASCCRHWEGCTSDGPQPQSGHTGYNAIYDQCMQDHCCTSSLHNCRWGFGMSYSLHSDHDIELVC